VESKLEDQSDCQTKDLEYAAEELHADKGQKLGTITK